MLYHGKNAFTSATLKSGEVVISAVSFDLLHAVAAFENERPLPPDILPLYFSPGYNTDKEHVGADVATSRLLSSVHNSHYDTLRLVLQFATPPQAKSAIYVTQIKYDKDEILSQVIVVESTEQNINKNQ